MIDGDGQYNGINAALTYLRNKYRTRQQRDEDVLLMAFSFALGAGFIALVVTVICRGLT